MLTKGLSLRGIEVFDALARSGSVQGAAQLTGLSQPAVSQQITNLETAMGVGLLDRNRRPMQLTRAGQSFLVHCQTALGSLRQAQAELTMMEMGGLGQLSIGVIDDFDNDVTPSLMTAVAKSMDRCLVRLMTAASHEMMSRLESGELDLCVAASPGGTIEGVTEYPILRDPFVLATPVGLLKAVEDPLAVLRQTPMLRYGRDQMIGRQIEAQLARLKLGFAPSYEIGNNRALMAMVAAREGWALTTPLSYLRPERFQDQIEIHHLPFPRFSRVISLFASSALPERLCSGVAQTLRGLVATLIVEPAHGRLPWLREGLQVLED